MAARCALGLALGLRAWVAAGAAAAPPAPAPAPAPAPDLAALGRAVAAIVDQPRYAGAHWGLHVVRLDDGREWLSRHADRLFTPASNTKLFTAALALDRLGPDFRLRTSLYARSRPDVRGTLRGDLVVWGRGDFSFADRFHEGRLDAALTPLVDAVLAAGIRRIRGDLVADDRFFRVPAHGHGAGWEWDDFASAYGAGVGALNAHDNVVRVHLRSGAGVGAPVRAFLEPPCDLFRLDCRATTAPVGAEDTTTVTRALGRSRIVIRGRLPLRHPGRMTRVAVPEPSRWFIHLLADALRRAGIRIDGQPRLAAETAPRPDHAPGWVEIAGVNSPPLRELLPAMLKPSQNQYAQLLWLQVGAQAAMTAASVESPHLSVEAATEPPTEALARQAMREFVNRLGLPTGGVFIEEGSGLSRHNAVTARALTTLLRRATAAPWGRVFRRALPAPGEAGSTLEHRLSGLPPNVTVRAKTGRLHRVYALAGYLVTADGPGLAFAILLNQADVPPETPSPTEDLDALVRRFAAELSRHGPSN